jgi:hypothetical protein
MDDMAVEEFDKENFQDRMDGVDVVYLTDKEYNTLFESLAERVYAGGIWSTRSRPKRGRFFIYKGVEYRRIEALTPYEKSFVNIRK